MGRHDDNSDLSSIDVGVGPPTSSPSKSDAMQVFGFGRMRCFQAKGTSEEKEADTYYRERPVPTKQ
jgi:hypothetical protein